MRTIILFILVLLILGSSDAYASHQVDHFAVLLEGKWELDPRETEDVGTYQCSQDPLSISISKETMTYKASFAKVSLLADILDFSSNGLHIQYRDEERLDNEGKPVSWWLVISDASHFYWVRNDWLRTNPNGRTVMRRKCAPSELSS